MMGTKPRSSCNALRIPGVAAAESAGATRSALHSQHAQAACECLIIFSFFETSIKSVKVWKFGFFCLGSRWEKERKRKERNEKKGEKRKEGRRGGGGRTRH